MKKILSIAIFILAMTQLSWAYDFAYTYEGKTLFYNITNSSTRTVEVTYQNSTRPRYSNLSGDVIIPSSITRSGTTYTVTAIGNSAFSGCSGLESVTIPESITSIGNCAFANCAGLTTVNFNAINCGRSMSVSSATYHAFYGCTSFTTLNIGSNVTTIPEYAFYQCTHLTSELVIPSSVTTIGSSAFYNCPLSGSLDIPNSVTTIPSYCFCGCSGLESVTIPESITSIGNCAFANCAGLTTVNFNAINCGRSMSVSSATYHAFYGCTSFTTLNIGSYVTTIPEYAFYRCTHLTGELVIPSSVTTIGSSAFNNCSGYSAIHAHPTTPPTFGSNAFCNVSSNIPVYVPCGCTDSYYSSWPYFTNISEEFAYMLSVTSSNDTRGSVSIVTEPSCTSSNAQIRATANTGYLFDHWSNGSTSNPYTLSVTSDTTLIAYFTPINYTIAVASDNASFGSVSGGGTFPYGTQAQITAIPNQGCRFTGWNDGNTSNPRTVTVTGNETYTAYFSNQHIITVQPNNPAYGTVSGGGTYAYNTTATISATANQGYRFTQWNDGNTSNPRTVTVTGNAAYTATFVPIDYTITVNSEDPTMGTASGGGTFPYNSQRTITATPNQGYEFRQWSDGNTSNPRTITVTGNATYTAQFSLKSYTITVNSHNNSMGTTTGSGTYEYGTSVTISAEPMSGFAFDYWGDDHSNTSRIRTVTVTGNATYTAYFRQIPAGISSVEADGYNISTLGNRIVVTTSGDEPVYVYDITGRLVSKTRPQGGELSIQVSQLGVYMVKVGNSPAHKVVVR